MSRGSGDTESQLQYYDLRYISVPRPQAEYNANPRFHNGTSDPHIKYEYQPETSPIDGLRDIELEGSQTYSHFIESISCAETGPDQQTMLQLDKPVQGAAIFYDHVIHPLVPVQCTDMVQQQHMLNSTAHSSPAYYGLDYVPTEYYPEPFHMPSEPMPNPYFLENTAITKEPIRLSPIKFCSNCFTTETPSWRRCSEGKNLLCNACGLYEKLHHAPRKICLHPDGSTKIVRHNTSENEGCAMCGTTYSPLWRKLDKKCYCNSCAIRFGIGHSKRMSLPQIWPDSVSNERDTVDPYQNTGGLLFSSLTPSSQRDV